MATRTCHSAKARCFRLRGFKFLKSFCQRPAILSQPSAFKSCLFWFKPEMLHWTILQIEREADIFRPKLPGGDLRKYISPGSHQTLAIASRLSSGCLAAGCRRPALAVSGTVMRCLPCLYLEMIGSSSVGNYRSITRSTISSTETFEWRLFSNTPAVR